MIKTLDQLMEGKAPGSVKLCSADWDSDRYWCPYFKDADGDWVGIDCDGFTTHAAAYSTRYKIYTLPRKTVRMWPVVMRDKRHFVWISSRLFKSVTDAETVYADWDDTTAVGLAPDSYGIDVPQEDEA
jgi:hypothetical protein